jgi:acyl carrier protein
MYEKIRSKLIEVITDIQNKSGHPITTIDDDTCPVEELPGFDSLNTIEAITIISIQLNLEIESEIMFQKENGHNPTIREIARRIANNLQENESK